MRRVYQYEGPWYRVALIAQVVNEEDEDGGADEGGEALSQSKEVEGEWWVGRRFARGLEEKGPGLEKHGVGGMLDCLHMDDVRVSEM